MKRFLVGFLSGALIFGTVGAFAASYIANPAGFKVVVNGEEFTSDPPAMVINDRTYLPLRAIGDALGVPVAWNDALQQAEVGIISEQEPSQENLTWMQKSPYIDFIDQFVSSIEYSGFYYVGNDSYDLFNMPASENGMKGKPICIAGYVSDVLLDETVISIIVQSCEDTNKQWLVGITTTDYFDYETCYERLMNKVVVAGGSYRGYSYNRLLPALTMDRIYVYLDGDFEVYFVESFIRPEFLN